MAGIPAVGEIDITIDPEDGLVTIRQTDGLGNAKWIEIPSLYIPFLISELAEFGPESPQ